MAMMGFYGNDRIFMAMMGFYGYDGFIDQVYTMCTVLNFFFQKSYMVFKSFVKNVKPHIRIFFKSYQFLLGRIIFEIFKTI